MIQTVTDVAEVLGLLSIALGLSWLTYQKVGPGLALIVFGVVILFMSAILVAASKRKGGNS